MTEIEKHFIVCSSLLEKLVYASGEIAHPVVFLAFPLQIYDFLIVCLPVLYY